MSGTLAGAPVSGAPAAARTGTTGRHWAAWVGLWAVGASALLWGTAGIEAVDLLRYPRVVEPDVVAASSTTVRLAPVLGIALTVAFLGALTTWVRPPVACHVFLAVGALALLLSAWAWPGVPDAGPWWPVAGVVAGTLALVGLPAGAVGPESGGEGRVAGLALAGAGVAVAVLGWRGLEYHDWYPHLTVTGPMWVALVVGLVLVPLGLLGHRLPATSRTSTAAVVVAGTAALVVLVPAVLWMVDLGLLQRHEESESGWEGLLPVVVGTGFLAAAVAARRRWWPLMALSLAVALALGCGAVLRSDLARFLW